MFAFFVNNSSVINLILTKQVILLYYWQLKLFSGWKTLTDLQNGAVLIASVNQSLAVIGLQEEEETLFPRLFSFTTNH